MVCDVGIIVTLLYQAVHEFGGRWNKSVSYSTIHNIIDMPFMVNKNSMMSKEKAFSVANLHYYVFFAR